MARKTELQFLVESYQRLKKWYLMPPCLILSIVRNVSRVKWSKPGKGVVPSPIPWCCSCWKRRLRVTLDYCYQLYLQLHYQYIYIYIYIYVCVCVCVCKCMYAYAHVYVWSLNTYKNLIKVRWAVIFSVNIFLILCIHVSLYNITISTWVRWKL